MKKIAAFLIAIAVSTGAFAVVKCDPNLARSLNAANAHIEATGGAEDWEIFDSNIDLLVKNSPDCLFAIASELDEGTKKRIMLRVDDMIKPVADLCEPITKQSLGYDEMAWCGNLRDDKKNCFDDKGKPFNWCHAYRALHPKFKDSFVSHAKTH